MITLCMVVRNEAARLEGCLERLRPYVSQIIIVDTGSTDATLEIAYRLGAEVFIEPFVDFAQARNTALRLARGDWIMVMDPDEEIEDEDLKCLASLISTSDVVGYRFPRYDYIGRGGWGLSRPCRLFRRFPEVAYFQPVFEEPVFPSELAASVVTCWGISIHHYGFRHPEPVLMHKRKLYSSLLERCLREADQPWVKEALALLAADAGDFNRALDWMMDIGDRRLEWLPHKASLNQARLWMAVGLSQQTVKWAKTVLADSGLPPYQRSRVENVNGLALARLGQLEEALLAFQRALDCGLPVAAYFLNLGLTQFTLKRQAEGERSIGAALKINHRLIQEKQCKDNASLQYQDQWLHRLDTINAFFC